MSDNIVSNVIYSNSKGFFRYNYTHTALRRELRSSTLTKHPATSKTDSVIFTLESLTGVEAFANTDTSTGKKYKSNFIIK